jgi:lipopolysaccharide export system protein LptC
MTPAVTVTSAAEKKPPLMRTRWATLAMNRALESLPLLVMALLAAATYYLVQVNLRPAPREAKAPQHEPDYSLINFQARSFTADGALRSTVSGARMDHFPDTDTAEVKTIRSWGRNDQGLITQVSADKALANGDGSELQLFGNARVWRDAAKDRNGKALQPMELRSEFLHVWLREERAKTHKPVVLTRGESVAKGDRMETNNYHRTLQLSGRVTGSFVNDKASR